jgi:multiple sugar transport system permease protein
MKPVLPIATAFTARGLRLAVLWLAGLFFGIPLVWLFLAPTKTDDELADGPAFAFGSLGNVGRAWDNLMLYNDGVLLQWAVNSVIYTGATVILAVATSILAGYALARLPVPGRQTLLTITLVSMLMPAAALVLPLFLEIEAAGLTNTAWSVILPSAFYPFGVYLAFIYFSTSLPPDLLAAGRLDGCGEWQLFRHVALPLSRPLLSLLAFFAFIANWNNYFLPYVMLSEEEAFPLPVGLAALASNTPALYPQLGGSQLPIERPEIALASVVVVAPVIVLFIFSQRFLIRGTVAGAIKD